MRLGVKLQNAVLLSLSCANLALATVPVQRWTPDTSVEMRYFASAAGGYGENNVVPADVVYSPDHSWFFAITRRGDLDRDCNVYQIFVYSTSSVRRSLSEHGGPRYTADRSTSVCSADSFEAGVFQVRWTRDSSALLFVSSVGREPRQVRVWSLPSNAITTLTSGQVDVDSYDFSSGAIGYVASTPSGKDEAIYEYPMTRMVDAYRWERGFDVDLRRYAIYLKSPTAKVCQVGGSFPWIDSLRRVFLAPNGAWAILTAIHEPKDVPSSWREYHNSVGVNTGHFVEYRLVNVLTCEEHAITGAPLGEVIDNQSTPQVLWSPDSKSAILANSMALCTNGDITRLRTSYLVIVEVPSAKYSIIGEMPKTEMSSVRPGYLRPSTAAWITPGRRFSVTDGQDDFVFALRSGRWVREVGQSVVSRTDARRSGLSMSIAQDLNTPPELVVRDEAGNSLVLTDEDKALSGVKRYSAEVVPWSDPEGHPWKGLLVCPDCVAGENTPRAVVLQIAGRVYDDKFLPDGGLAAGFAAQAFASRGFVVLTIQSSGPGHNRTGPGEGATFVKGIGSAIEYLRARYSISKIGIIGFSHTGYLTEYLVTHPAKYPVAAAMVQDAWDGSYVQYLFSTVITDEPRLQREFFEGQVSHERTFWDDPEDWFASAPGFGAARVQSPLLLTKHGAFAGGLVSLLESYGALRLLAKPVDVVVIPEATHTLLRPQHRRSAMELALDWMSFWLCDKEDLDRAKTPQYLYWRELRANWRHEAGDESTRH